MIRVVAKLAGRVAVSRRGGQRGRAWLVVIAVGVFTAATWCAAGFWSASQRNEVRDRARMPVVSFSNDGVGVPMVEDSLPIMDGRQFEIHWLGADAESVPAEFGGRLPAPGKGFVSPGLLEASGGVSGFHERFGVGVDEHSGDVRWDRVTAFAEEFLAFATLPEGLVLPEARVAGQQRFLVGFDAEELGAGLPTGFQTPSGLVAVPHSLDERLPSPSQALTGALFGLLIPGLLVLGLGLSAHSTLRAQRSDALVYLGAGPNSLDVFDAAEAAVLSVPVALVVSAMMWGVLGVPTTLPSGSVEYLPGDLRPGAGPSGVALVLVLLVPVAVGALMPKVTAWRTRRKQRTIKWGGLVLLLVPVAVSAASTLIPPQARALRFVAVLASVVSVVPLVAVAVLPWLGTLLVVPDRVARLLAGRRFQWGDKRGSDLIRITTLTVVAVVVVSSINLLADSAALEESSSRSGIVTIDTFAEVDQAAFTEFDARVPGAPIGAVVDGQVFVANCEQLAALVDVSAQGCATNPERFMNEVNRSESRRFETYTIGNPPPDRPVGQMIARVDSDSQARALQANANAMFGPSSVLGWEYLGPNPITGWISPLGAAAVGLFGVAVALLIANTIRFPSQSDQSLVWLAAPAPTRRAVLRWGLHSAVLFGVLLGSGYGIIAVSAGTPGEITQLDHVSLAITAITCGIAISAIVETSLWARARKP